MGIPDDALKIVLDGVTINCTSVLVTPTVLPLNTAGEFPRVVRIQADTNPVYVKVGPAASGANSAVLTPTLSSILVHPNNPILLNTRGMQYVGGIMRGTLTGNINVVPVEF